MRLLTFLQTAENQKEITFDSIEKEMQVPTDEVESFIIEGTYFSSKTKLLHSNKINFSGSNENDTL